MAGQQSQRGIKDHLEQAKRDLIYRLSEEYQELNNRDYISDSDIKRLEMVERQLAKVQDDIDYNRLLRLKMANTLKQQRSYWRNYNSTLAERRTSLDYWAAFIYRYEPDYEEEDRDELLTLMHQDDKLCVTKKSDSKGTKSGKPTSSTQLVH